MNTTSSSDKPVQKYQGSKPLQSLSYSEKTKNENEWGKQNLEYFLGTTNFPILNGKSDMKTWYNAYNNNIDSSLFEYVTNPLNSTDAKFKGFPAKIRAYNIIRPNVDLLIGEWSKRPFKFDVINVDGDDVYNSHQEAMYDAFSKNLSQRVSQNMQQLTGNSGGMPDQEVPEPKLLLDELNSNYRDVKAIKGYKSLKTLQFELNLKEKFKNLFKDWLLAGQVGSLKFPKHNEVEYTRVSPIDMGFDKSIDARNGEDGTYATVRFRPTVADVVDMFYDELKEKHLKQLEQDENVFRGRLWEFVGNGTAATDRQSKVDLYYCTWKSRKKMGILSYTNPATNEPEQLEVDESYVPDKEAGETVEWLWINEPWNGWRLNSGERAIYLGIGPVTCPRNEENNISKCKLPFNSRRFSDTESDNISLVSLGMPYQIMYIILMYRIELAIAKSKGKIIVMDQNVIPDGAEEGEEKFLYYAEALGYMLIDRSQDGVDRSFNQYQEFNMSQYENIGQLINLANYFKSQWDELLGITRQRKGQQNSSDGLGVSEQAIFRSTVISDIIFSDFDEWIQSELQGLLDCTRYAWIDGKKGYYQSDDGRLELFSLEADEVSNLSCGVYVDSLGATADKLRQLKEQINAFAQRKDIKMSVIADMIFSDSYAEISAKLKKAEAIEMKMAQDMSANEEQMQERQAEIQQTYKEFEHMLDVDLMEKEWDRKDNNELVKGEIAGRTAKAPSGMDIDMTAIVAESNKRLSDMEKQRTERDKLRSKEKIEHMKDLTNRLKIKASLKNKVVGEK